MANYLQLFEDAACTRLWKTIPCDTIMFNSIGGHGGLPGILAVGGKTYNYYDWALPTLFYNIQEIKSNPFLTINRPDEATRRVYCKNGFSVRIGSSPQGTAFGDFMYNGETLPFSDEGAGAGRYWAISFFDATTAKNYIGFTRQNGDTWSDYAPPIACIEADFWTDAFKPAYDYGSKPSVEGGQGTGSINDGSITRGQQTGAMPTGGRGLHWYRMPNAGFNSVQDFLWGEGLVVGTSMVSTIAKSLWQKFQNKTHGPSQCIVGAYKLPDIFMPARGGASGVQLAGINLPTSDTYVTSPGFVYKRINLGTQTPPFQSWLDYQGVTCKIGVPFCGEIACPVEAIWDKEVMIRYCCDQHNGNLVATVWSGGHVLGEMSGNCAYQIPVVGGDDGTIARLGALVGTAASAVAAIATDGASLALGGVVAGAASAAGAQHHTYVTNCNLSGNVSSCINGVAYIDFIYPSTAYPDSKAYADGYGFVASAAHGTIGGFKGGYGEFTVLKRDGGMFIPRATDAEKDEIIRLLETGVIV